MRHEDALLHQQQFVARQQNEIAPVTTTRVGIKCSCGSTKFEMPKNPKASETINCAKCGASGKYGDVMRQAKSQAKSAIEKQLKDVFRKAGFK